VKIGKILFEDQRLISLFSPFSIDHKKPYLLIQGTLLAQVQHQSPIGFIEQTSQYQLARSFDFMLIEWLDHKQNVMSEWRVSRHRDHVFYVNETYA
jgi:hypothetical protein